MKLWTPLFVLAFAACSGTPTPAPSKPEAAAKGEAKEGKAKKGKKPAAEGAAQGQGGGEEGEDKAEKEDANAAPVLRTGRFRIPLKDLPADSVGAIRTAMVAAWEKSAKEEGTEPPKADEQPKAWKCRHATVWETSGATPAPQLRLFERLSDVDCKKAEAKEERWELSLRYQTPAKPEKKDLGGKLKYLMASTDLDWDGSAYATTYGSVYRVEGGDTDGGFPHDDAWVKEQLPSGVTVGAKKAELDSWRWAIGTVTIGGEKVTVEAERWSCGDKVAGAELVFRTNKRAPGHTTQSPKDVVITDKIKAFADAFVKELGDKVGGKGAVSEAGLTCGG